MHAYIPKPYKPDDLILTLEKAIKVKRNKKSIPKQMT